MELSLPPHPEWAPCSLHASSDGAWLALMAHVYLTGIFFSSGARWRAGRQFTVRTLQSLGVQQPSMVGKVLQELACLKGQLDSYGGEWGTGMPLPSIYSHLRPFSLTYRPAPPPGAAGLGTLQHHLHTSLRPAL
jgi:hypothetical protein